MLNLQILEWHDDVWSPDGVKQIKFQWADLSNKLDICATYDVVVKLCKWSTTYSINMYEDEDLVSSLKSIPHRTFEDEPQPFLEDALEKFLSYFEEHDEYDYWPEPRTWGDL